MITVAVPARIGNVVKLSKKLFIFKLPSVQLNPCVIFTGLPGKPSHKFGLNGLPGEGRYEGLVPRNDVLTNGFI